MYTYEIQNSEILRIFLNQYFKLIKIQIPFIGS